MITTQPFLLFSLPFNHPLSSEGDGGPPPLHSSAPPPLTGQAADGLGLVHMVLWLVLLISLLAPASFHILSFLALSLPLGPDVFVQSKQRRSEALTQMRSRSSSQVE